MFQRALQNRLIDPGAEFNVARTSHKAEPPLPDPVKGIFDFLRGIFQ